MTEILNHSQTQDKEPLISYNEKQVESTAIDTVFDLLFQKVIDDMTDQH